MDDCDLNNKPILKVQDNLSAIKKDIQIIKTDLSYIKNKLKSISEAKEKQMIKEVQASQDGWWFYPK
tara:strand:- start:719 stop:919 length:201 start_codon:yes stop_codon:yes gene_type:complete